MKQEHNAELEYQGVTDDHLKTQQLDAAIRALHVLAVLKDTNIEWMNTYALDALKEIESLGYTYDVFSTELN